MTEHAMQQRGGFARAQRLTAEELSEIGRRGAKARWKNRKPKPPPTAADIERARFGILALRAAQRMFTVTGCPKTVERIKRCITSAEGALRNLELHQIRAEIAASEKDA